MLLAASTSASTMVGAWSVKTSTRRPSSRSRSDSVANDPAMTRAYQAGSAPRWRSSGWSSWIPINLGSGNVNTVTLGDLDFDGDLDIACGDSDGRVHILQNGGRGSTSPWANGWTAVNIYSDGSVDINALKIAQITQGNGVDVIGGGSNSRLYVWGNTYFPFSGGGMPYRKG